MQAGGRRFESDRLHCVPMSSLLVVLSLASCARRSGAPSEPGLEPALTQQRSAIRDADVARLSDMLDAALAREDWLGAARAVVAGHALDPDRFTPAVPTLIEHLPATVGAELARGVGNDAMAQRLEATAIADAIRARYADRETPSAFTGVSTALGTAVIGAARDKYVDPINERAWFAAARDRLGLVAESFDVPLPEVAPAEPAPFESLWAAAIAASLPEPIVVAESTEAALASLDAWSKPVWPAEIAAWTRQHDGLQVGIGVQIFEEDRGIVVGYPVPGTAAWDAEVHQDDLIIGVGELTVAKLPPPRIDAVVEALVGEPGTSVVVRFDRAGAVRTVPLIRRSVPAPTVVGFRRGADNRWVPWFDEARGIAYARIRALRPYSDDEFDALLDGVAPRALILDLRGNGGGDLTAAIDLADRFVADGILAEREGRTVSLKGPGEGEVAWNAAVPGHAFEALERLVVVVDEGTGSSAELLADTLRARANAVIVGQRTVGKTASQVLGQHPDGLVAWQITHARIRAPGRPAFVGGVIPDHEVTLSPAEGVLVDGLLRQREHLRTHRDGSPIRFTGEPAAEGTLMLDRDPQLAMAAAVIGL